MSDDRGENVELASSQDDVSQLGGTLGPSPATHFASRFDGFTGIIAPVLTTILAFLVDD